MTDHRTGAVERSPRASRLDRPVVIENGVDLTTVRHVRPSDRRGGVLFVGSMHHRPNVDAALRLCTEIMPRVWQRRPGLPLVIVGGPIPPELRTAAAQASRDASASVQLPGRVTEMAPYLEDARVYASPLAHGAGSSLKIVEALASGAPLVSSELGARGFGLIPGTHYLAADSNEEHAQAILQLLDQPALAESLGAEGRAMAERYGWHALGARFVDLALTCAACPDSHAMP